jgi:hypothetical protein
MHHCSRRTLFQTFGIAGLVQLRHSTLLAQAAHPAYGYPMGLPGRPPGDGCYVRVAYAAENARYYPGWWHTGENWHRLDDETAGMAVLAVAAGEVVFAGYDYPGLVVIIAHPDGLYSMYGHLDYVVAVEVGQKVARGQLLGTVLARSDDLARSHLHFELRTFFTRDDVNGTVPQYGVNCGYECPPGPGYWPMAAPEHPSQLGWRNPIHVINRRSWPDGIPDGADVMVTAGAPRTTPLWTAPADLAGAEQLGALALEPGATFPILEIDTGEEGAIATSAESTRLWYRIAPRDGEAAWVQAVVPVTIDTGGDGRPSSLRLDFVPDITTE